MLSNPCTSPQPHLSIFLQSEKKNQLDTWCGNLPAKWLRLSRSIFLGPFSNGENQAFIPLRNQDCNSLGTVSLKKRRKLNLSWNRSSQKKRRTCFRSCQLGDLNQTKLEETAWCMFLWDNFLVLLSTHNSQHNWMLQTGSEQIVLNDTVSTQVQRQDPLWWPFLPSQRGHSACSSARDRTASQRGDAPCLLPRAPRFEGWR